MASIAVFVALGGGAYAAVTIDGKDLRDRSVAAKKLKNNTLSGKQINEKRLGRVPRSRAALRARYALRAGSADSAAKAGTANSATTAGSATTAANATRAATAGRADSAATADNAAMLGGADRDSLLVTCPADTELLGGVCWDDTARPSANWFTASTTCFTDGARLPTLSELYAYLVAGPDVGRHWSADIESFVGGSPSIATQDEATTGTENGSTFSAPYRCVFNQSNDL